MHFSIKRLVFPILLLLQYNISAQVITTNPEFPTVDRPVNIYFYADLGSQGLMDYSGDIYAHTGVLTENSTGTSDWKYVIAGWSENTPKAKLTRISQNQYVLQIKPSIREFYGFPETEDITHLAFVFRNGDGSLTGKEEDNSDIFYEVFSEGVNVKITKPIENFKVVKQNYILEFEAVATLADTMAIYTDNEFKKGAGAVGNITDTLPTSVYGDHEVVVWASNSEEEDRDTFAYFVRSDPIVEELPAGIVDGINYISRTSVILSFFAPGKESIFAVGDFSDWNLGEDNYMKITPDGERFWLQIDGLDPAKFYRFYYHVEGPGSPYYKFSDPYSEFLLDPKDHKHITEETYPGMKDLLAGLDDIQYSVIHTGKEPYPWNITDFTPPEKTDLVIYELLLRDFLAAHDWITLIDTLDYLENLGINAIELMPFNEFNGNESWGYNPIHFFSPDKYYGPEDDLKAFVDECHSRGIAVIQDIVFNHIEKWSTIAALYLDKQEYPSADNPWLNEDYDLNDPNGWYQARHPYNVFFDFDHSSIHTQNLMDRSTRYWMEEYKIDGFRFDLTKGFTQKSTYLGTDDQGNARYNESGASSYDSQRILFLKRMADAIWAVKDDAWVILEHFCDNSEEKELANYGMMVWGNLNHNYNEATMGYNENGKSDFSWISYKKRGWNEPNLVGYMESHDEERLMFKNLAFGNGANGYYIKEPWTALERMELAGAFFFTIPGPKMIWQFGELGYDYGINDGCRVCNKPIRWDYFSDGRRNRLYQVWASLIKLRIKEAAFETTDFSLDLSDAVKRIELNHPDMDVRIIGNFDVIPQASDPAFSKTGMWYEYFSGNSINVSDLNILINLGPGEYRIYTSKKLDAFGYPDIKPGPDVLRVFPNPVSDLLNIEPIQIESEIIITDMFGKMVMQSNLGPFQDQIDLSSLKEGLYIISRYSFNSDPKQAKILKVIRQ